MMKVICNVTYNKYIYNIDKKLLMSQPRPLATEMPNQKPPIKSMSMRQLYRQVSHIIDNGIEGYRIVKKYEDPTLNIKSRQQSTHKKKIRQLKRGSYLQDQLRIKRDIPGVWKYDITQKQKPKLNKSKNISEKKTYLDQAIQRSNKQQFPAPGQYDNILQMMGSKLAGIHVTPYKKIIGQKINYLDNAQYQGTLTPGVGQYQITKPIRSKTQHSASANQLKPQYWRQHHKQLQKIVQEKNKNSGPDMRAYNPKPLQYELFQNKKKISKAQSQHKLQRIQKSIRFKTQGMDKVQLGPGKYNILNEWAPKQKNKKSLLSIISKASPPSVYYH